MIFIRYYSDLILDKGINNIDEVKQALEKGKLPKGFLYAICVSPLSRGLFVICSMGELLKAQKLNLDYGIVAFCKNGSRARAMLRDIVESRLIDHKDLTGIKEYYNSNCI